MLIDDYIAYYDTYSKTYGVNTIVLMEVGSFYELYAIDNEKIKKGGDIYLIANILNIQVSRKNKNILENSRNNHLLAGFPSHSLKKFIDILINNKYTIVLVEQTTLPPNPKREVTEIISPSTYIDNIQESSTNYFMNIFVENGTNRKSQLDYYAISWCAIDISTGKVYLNELNHSITDNNIIFEEIHSILLTFKPIELCVSSNDNIKKEDHFLNMLNIENNKNCKFHNHLYTVSCDYTKKSFQEETLLFAYEKPKSMLNIFETLGIEYMLLGSICLSYSIRFLYNHSPLILTKIQNPLIDRKDSSSYLHLVYNCASQLNIIENGLMNERSLLSILNNCDTAIGKRYFNYRLMNPMKDVNTIKKSYGNIELFIKNIDLWKTYPMKQICDLERLSRKLCINRISTNELLNIYSSVSIIKNISSSLPMDIEKQLYTSLNAFKEMLSSFINLFVKIFNVDELSKCNIIQQLNHKIFQKGVNVNIDALSDAYDKDLLYFKNLTNNLNIIVRETYFKLEYNDRDGYYITSTIKRFDFVVKTYPSNEHVKSLMKKNISLINIFIIDDLL